MCSWKRNKPKFMSTQRIPTSCIVVVKIAWACRGGAKSVHTCRRIFPFFFFLLYLQIFICFYSTTLTLSSLGFMRMKWAQLLSGSFFFFSFFLSFFFCFSSIFLAKKKNLLSFHWWCSCPDVCRIWPQRLLLFFFAPKLWSLGARLRPRWKKMRPEKWHQGKFCDWHRRDFSSPDCGLSHGHFVQGQLCLGDNCNVHMEGVEGVFKFSKLWSKPKHVRD